MLWAFKISLGTLNFVKADNNAVIYDYIDQYKDIAMDEMTRAGIPASIKLAQAILESNAGRSYLAVNGNNHFGIKCGKYWTGGTVMREDDDYENGKLIKSCFRAYPSASYSFRAHSDFLRDPKKAYRYGPLFELEVDDYVGWSKGLKKAGYATNPAYADKLISLIQRFELYLYDLPPIVTVDREIIKEDVEEFEEKIAQTPESTNNIEDKPIAEAPKPKKNTDFFIGESSSYSYYENNGVKHIKAEYGDNLETIALETGIPLADLICYNDDSYDPREILNAQSIIYVEPKKNKYRGRKTYTTMKGESLIDIAQKFGVKLAKLAKRNKFDNGYRPRTGELIYLRGRRK